MAKNTPQQLELFKWVDLGKGHGVLMSVAGSGKTTSILQALNYIDDELPVVVCSFTKIIAEELSRRVRAERFFNVQSATLNSLGWGICKANVQGVKLDTFKTDNILRWVLSRTSIERDFQMKVFAVMKGSIKRIVGLLKSYVIRPDDPNFKAQVKRLFQLHDVETPEGDNEQVKWARENFNNILQRVYSASVEHVQEMDFDDQKFMPVFYGWKPVSPTWIIIDECQDCNLCDLRLVESFLGPETRSLWVGDPRQAIYGFRGSLSDAVDQIIERFSCTKLALTVCWRCPDSVIRDAQRICPEITGPVPNPKGEGSVTTISTKEFLESARAGDYVICRTSAPLVKRCLGMLQKGIPAKVKGKDIGKSLLALIELVQKRVPMGLRYEEFIPELQLYKSEQLAALERANREEAAMALSDKTEALEIFALECQSYPDLERKIEELFTDEGDDSKLVMFMTGHKCKGLQNPRVFFLRPDLCPHPRAQSDNAMKQEQNLRYVITTRAEAELIYVLKEKDEK